MTFVWKDNSFATLDFNLTAHLFKSLLGHISACRGTQRPSAPGHGDLSRQSLGNQHLTSTICGIWLSSVTVATLLGTPVLNPKGEARQSTIRNLENSHICEKEIQP